MRKYNKIIRLCSFLVLVFSLMSCNQSKKSLKNDEKVITYSNIASNDSVKEVENLLLSYLNKDSVDSFINTVNEYNEIVKSVGLKGDFEKSNIPEYDVIKIKDLWYEKKGDFIGTNCRINTYMLLKNNIEIPQLKIDDKFLFLDNDAIELGNLFKDEDIKKFQMLFSRVETVESDDVKIHAKNMEEHFSSVKFDDNARMISVIIHDNLDGNSLFIGHTGVLVPTQEGFLFVEKLSFEEPYQAIKFKTKEECYKYLQEKYANYTGEGLSKPFIMDNGKWVEVK